MRSYALVGLGAISPLYYTAIVKDFSQTARLVALCDTNQTRLDYANSRLKALGHAAVPTYKAEHFDDLVAETQPDEIIVASPDFTHHTYIIRALDLGCDVVAEKPLTIDAGHLGEIFDAVQRNRLKKRNNRIRVTFNYRYTPYNTKVYQLLHDDAIIGDVTSIHFEWVLDTSHGADYFRRWHREKSKSGGLLLAKSTHHFDLVNFWLRGKSSKHNWKDPEPETVAAMGGLRFYGKANAQRRGVSEFYSRAHDGGNISKADPFALHLNRDPELTAMFLDAESEDGYHRDQSVFGDGIDIEDTLGVLVRYDNGTVLTYSLVAYAPWEGYRVSFNGTKGRLDLTVVEKARTVPHVHVTSVTAAAAAAPQDNGQNVTLVLQPMWEAARKIEIEGSRAGGGHGGGDGEFLRSLFGEPTNDPYERGADLVDGAKSILIGLAANRSIETGEMVKVIDVFDLHARIRNLK